MWFCKVTWQIKYFLSPLVLPMATKNGKVVTNCERLSPINLHNPLNMQSHEVTWKIENIISSLSRCLWLPPINVHDPSRRWSCEVMWHIKYFISTLQRTHEHQTEQGTDLPWEASTYKATWPFDHVTNVRSRDNLKNLCLHFYKSYGLKLGRLLFSGRMFSMQIFKSSPTSCIISMR